VRTTQSGEEKEKTWKEPMSQLTKDPPSIQKRNTVVTDTKALPSKLGR
jgi:hypothetical protein